MNKRNVSILILMMIISSTLFSQKSTTEVYLISCSPGSESSSMYGHSALRLVDSVSGSDMVYNWGVFDFDTPNFNYKFARGRLNYKLGVYKYKSFLLDYFNEERSVYMQKINMDDDDIRKLRAFLKENLKEENLYYRYDFFLDNCATRIRDIFEFLYSDDLIYPEYEGVESPSYRDRLDEYKGSMLWLDAGIDLLLGTVADENCNFRGSMFLPDYLMSNLKEAQINRDNSSISLLQPAITVFEFEKKEIRISLLNKPWFILSLIAFFVLIFTFMIRGKLIQGIFDQVFFILLFVLAFLMIFTNYLTEHDAMANNFNMLWLNPLLLIAPFVIFFKNRFNWLWSLNIALSIIFMILTIFIKQDINAAFIPVILILIIRSYYRLSLHR